MAASTRLARVDQVVDLEAWQSAAPRFNLVKEMWPDDR
jgi:hypothetical protein